MFGRKRRRVQPGRAAKRPRVPDTVEGWIDHLLGLPPNTVSLIVTSYSRGGPEWTSLNPAGWESVHVNESDRKDYLAVMPDHVVVLKTSSPWLAVWGESSIEHMPREWRLDLNCCGWFSDFGFGFKDPKTPPLRWGGMSLMPLREPSKPFIISSDMMPEIKAHCSPLSLTVSFPNFPIMRNLTITQEFHNVMTKKTWTETLYFVLSDKMIKRLKPVLFVGYVGQRFTSKQ